MIQKSRCLVLLFALLLFFTACQTKTVEPSSQDSSNISSNSSNSTVGKITLAYTATDSLDPFEVKTKSNSEIVKLLFDSLVSIDSSFKPQNVLAEKIELTDSACTVTLKSGITFSDSTALTANDVVYSLDKARNSELSLYKDDLSNVSSVVADSDSKVIITLSHADDYFVNFLDIPIIKANSDGQKNEDLKDIPPIGTGRYIFSQLSGEYFLTPNSNWTFGEITNDKIYLLNLPDDSAVEHALHSNELSVYYTDNTHSASMSMSGKVINVPMNNLVYLGVSDYGKMSDINIRTAISRSIDRDTMVSEVFFGAASSAKGIYHENFEDAKGFQTFNPTVDTEGAVEALKLAGYSTKDSHGFYVNADNKRLSISIIYNLENSSRGQTALYIKDELESLGIETECIGKSYTDYANAIRYGNYDLYVAEVKIPLNMNPYSLLTAGGIKTITVETDNKNTDAEATTVISAAKAAYNMQIGTGTLSETVSCFNDQLPIIPLCHRSGSLIYNGVSDGLTPTTLDPLNGIQNIKAQ